jgi:hypothetical protein
VATRPAAPCCPACGGEGGHRHVMTESHVMSGTWGQPAESVDSGPHVRPIVRSRVECIDCGLRFTHPWLVKQGLA